MAGHFGKCTSEDVYTFVNKHYNPSRQLLRMILIN
ncbi:protein of unknown function (plasmid) [Caballeronia sp. S22]